jgi:hypothetical protein
MRRHQPFRPDFRRILASFEFTAKWQRLCSYCYRTPEGVAPFGAAARTSHHSTFEDDDDDEDDQTYHGTGDL